MLKQDVQEYDSKLNEIKYYQNNRENEADSRLIKENTSLKLKLEQVGMQMSQFDVNKRMDFERSSKDTSVMQNEINQLSGQLSNYSRSNENLKSQITQITSD
jgi:predicted RNase H-like nuclease (RuvC/YqgF family)